MAVDFHRAEPGGLARVVETFGDREALGRFVTETAANDYPRLPVIQEENLFVTIADRREGEAALRLPGAEVETLLLRPTARSLIRPRA